MRHIACGLIVGGLLLTARVGSAAESTGVTAPGRIEAAGGVNALGSAATGVVLAVRVSEGDRVHAGQVLVTIDCRVIEAEAKVRDRELAIAAAVLSRTKNGYRVEEVASAAAAVKGAEASAEEAQTARQRAVALKVDNTATQARIDVAERDARTTAAALEQARQRLALLRAGSRVEDIEEATARRDTAAAALDETRAHLDQCSIRAPVDGIVVSSVATAGQFVSDFNQTPLVRIVDDGKLRVRAEVEEADLSNLCEGHHAAVMASGRAEPIGGTLMRLGLEPVQRSLPAGAKGEAEVRTAILSLDSNSADWPIGLPVTVRFEPCGVQKPAP